jgi:SAM-dependent MidA family methyltransferase
MTKLEEILIREICEKGPIPFYQYHALCLYHPLYGYYNTPRQKIGKHGDFYTSPSVHPVFGETVARFLLKKWEEIGRPSIYTVVEFGAGEGSMARALLDEANRLDPPFREALRCLIVERSSHMRALQQEKLRGYPVRWIQSLSEIAPFEGCVLSNELIDAFPVHVVKWTKHGWKEWYVDVKSGRLTGVWGDLSAREILDYINAYIPPLAVGQVAEINQDALIWLEKTAQGLNKGHILTIDYGFEADMLYHPSRRKGTLRAFRHHQLSSDVFASPGEMDLTHDVNFSAFMQYGKTIGLDPVFFGSQAEFLVREGILDRLVNTQGRDPFADEGLKRNWAVKHLIFPGALGTAFRVLVQQRRNG